jgi:predicted nucleic acid-binding protein
MNINQVTQEKLLFCVDSNIFITSFEKHHVNLRKFLENIDKSQIIISEFILTELQVGAEAGSQRYKQKVAEIQRYNVQKWCKKDRKIFKKFKTELALNKKRHQGKNKSIDWLIAAQAIRTGSILVTANRKDYEMIPGLKALYYDVVEAKFANTDKL